MLLVVMEVVLHTGGQHLANDTPVKSFLTLNSAPEGINHSLFSVNLAPVQPVTLHGLLYL